MARLQPDHIAKLREICGDKLFTDLTDALIVLEASEFTPNCLDNDETARVNKELERLRKALEGLSPTARFHIKFRYFGSLEGLAAPEFDPAEELLNSITGYGLAKEPTPRKRVGEVGLFIFNKFGLHAGSSERGLFVKYIEICFDALGYEHDARKTARDVLKGRTKPT